jgi:hypothetical protein
MVQKRTTQGLIATTRADVTPPLDELVRDCGWPLVLDATPRQLALELAHHEPQCLLFWLEERKNVARLAQLVDWARQRGTRPLRVAVAYQLGADVEATLREAGAHGFLPIEGRSTRRVPEALRSLVAGMSGAPAHAAEEFGPAVELAGRNVPLDLPTELSQPP